MEQGRDRPEHDLQGDGGERGIRAVLSLASTPKVPDGAMARLMARVEAEPQMGPPGVIAFTPRNAPKRSIWRYVAALPLAASLALGIYLGARGSLDFMMPAAVTGGLASSDDGQLDDLGGVGDADAYAQESTT